MPAAHDRPNHRGRFAPSPTGPLHFGSLVAALASFLQARSVEGTWLVRIDDVDVARTVPGTTRHILRDLERLGLHWDETVVYQSTRSQHYDAALSFLRTNQSTFPCGCSRKELRGQVYPGTCRHGLPPGKTARSIRLRCDTDRICMDDMIQGRFAQDLQSEVGDFVVKRGDGMHAYHLATVVDDALQDITDIVRGADLLDSTPRQSRGILVFRYLVTPIYLLRSMPKGRSSASRRAHDLSTPAAQRKCFSGVCSF